jgi:Rod binding domain-containing protein
MIDPTRADSALPGQAITPRAEAVQVAKQFEAIFVQQIVSKMRESADLLGENPMFGSGPGAQTYGGWFDSFMSEHLANSGRVGVAEGLMREFEATGQVERDESLEKTGGAEHDATRRIHQTV